MYNRIDILRTVGRNLKPYLSIEGKLTIRPDKIGNLIPGVVALTGTTILLETAESDIIDLSVTKGDEIKQNAHFEYSTNGQNGESEWATVENSCYYNDTERKIFGNCHHFASGDMEYSKENVIDYKDAPLNEGIQEKIKTIHEIITKIVGTPISMNFAQNIRECFTRLMSIICQFTETTLFNMNIKEKIKRDGKTMLFAFQTNNIQDNSVLMQGLVSTNGDFMTYHLDTKDAVIIGCSGQEDTPNYIKQSDSYKAYLKPEQQEKVNGSNIASTQVSQSSATKIQTEDTTDEEKILQLYDDGTPIDDIAKIVRHRAQTIRKIIHSAKNYKQLTLHHNANMIPASVRNDTSKMNTIKDLHANGASEEQIAETVNCTVDVVKRVLRTNNSELEEATVGNHKNTTSFNSKEATSANVDKSDTGSVAKLFPRSIISQEEIDEILKCFNDGMPLDDMQIKFHRGKKKINEIVDSAKNAKQLRENHDANIIPASLRTNPEKMNTIKDLHANGASEEQIAKSVNCTVNAVKRVLRANIQQGDGNDSNIAHTQAAKSSAMKTQTKSQSCDIGVAEGNKIKQSFRQGTPTYQLAKDFHHSKENILKFLEGDENWAQMLSEHEQNIIPASVRNDENKIKAIKDLYAQSASEEQIAKTVNCTVDTVKRVLHANKSEWERLQKEHTNAKYTSSEPKTTEQPKPEVKRNQTPVHTLEHYKNLMLNALVENQQNTSISRDDKIQKYISILVIAYLDGYNAPELEKICHCEGLSKFGAMKEHIIRAAMQKADTGEIEAPKK